jgi:hypothetical protein
MTILPTQGLFAGSVPADTQRDKESPGAAQKHQSTACIISPFATSAAKSPRSPLGLLWHVGQALATEAMAECIRSGRVGEQNRI